MTVNIDQVSKTNGLYQLTCLKITQTMRFCESITNLSHQRYSRESVKIILKYNWIKQESQLIYFTMVCYSYNFKL